MSGQSEDPSMDLTDHAARLNELEAVLRQPDAVMEPNILKNLREYVVAQGHPQQAVEFLTENYVGYAQMASLACGWLRILEHGQPSEPAVTTPPPPPSLLGADGSAPPSHSVIQPIPVEQFEKGAGIDASPLKGSQDVLYQNEGHEMDEAFFLRELVLEKFDPQKFAGIFSAGGSGAPYWLNELIADFEGRRLIYRLSMKYPNSLLLNFAIQKIVMQPGRDMEVVALGPSLVGHFGVFHRLLSVRLKQIASSHDQHTLQRLSDELCAAAGRSQHAYVHTQLMLNELSNNSGCSALAARFRRISQEMQEKAPSLVIWKMHRWFLPCQRISDSTTGHELDSSSDAARWVVSDVLASTADGTCSASVSDMVKLYRLYCKLEANQSSVPSISYLRHPRVIEALIRALFNPGKQLMAEAETACIGVLAIAVAGEEDGGGAAVNEQPSVVEVRNALQISARLGHKVSQNEEMLSEEEKKQAETAMHQRCCAAGVIHLLQTQLTSPTFWTSGIYSVHRKPSFLPLLLSIVHWQPRMHDAVLTLVNSSLAAMGHSSLGADISKALISVVVQMVKEGNVDTVLDWALDWARNADSGLIQYFFFGVLEIAGPPYSEGFARQLITLGRLSGTRRQRLGGKDWNIKAPLLHEFVETIGNVSFMPPLSGEDGLYVRELKTQLCKQ